MLKGRRKFGERFIKIRLKTIRETARQRRCQSAGCILFIVEMIRELLNIQKLYPVDKNAPASQMSRSWSMQVSVNDDSIRIKEACLFLLTRHL
jgi:hypothetical protein